MGAADDVVCNPATCLLTRRGRTVLLLRGGNDGPHGADGDDRASPVEPADCVGIALLVSPVPSHGACPGVPRIDRYTVWREGPQAIWLRRDGPLIESAQARGDRPWVPEEAARALDRPTLPMAQAE